MIRSMSGIVPVSFKLSTPTPELSQQFKASLGLSDEFDLANYMTAKDTDYIHVPMRALSATTVQGGLFDFGHMGGAPLRAATPLFNKLTIFKDHNQSVDSWLGKTSGAYWDATTPGVPPGVNFMLDVDTKADPRVARGLMTGALDSGSVTIRFDFEQSHPDMSPFDFLMNLGEEVDGEVVRALVTSIQRCMEYSVVWQGADTFAKVIGDDGKIYRPGIAQNSLSLNIPQEIKKMDLKALAASLGLDLGETVTLEALHAAVKEKGLTVTALAEAQTKLTTSETTLVTSKTELEAANTKVTELSTQVTTQATQVAALNAQVAELKPQAELGVKFLTSTRAEALRLYNLVEADKATEAMRNLIGGAELAVAQSFVSSYSARAEQLAPLKCSACGSQQVSRQASQQPEVPSTAATTVNKMEAERLNRAIASIHGK